jgi:transcription initiation factor TFIIIB Brf1 subunit/transcription initiation factor TFIIB
LCFSHSKSLQGKANTVLGERKVRIVGGLIYLKCREHNYRMTQKKVASIFNSSTERTIRKGHHHDWRKVLTKNERKRNKE